MQAGLDLYSLKLEAPPYKKKGIVWIGPVGSGILTNGFRVKVIGPTGSILLSNGEAG